MKLIIQTFILLTSSMLFSQTQKLKREAYQLKLFIDENKFYKQDIKESFYFVKEKELQIFSGEKIFVEVEIEKGLIKSMIVVDENSNPEKTIELELKQTVKNRVHKRTTLVVKNPLNRDLDYNAIMAIFGVKKWINTNVLPVKAGISSYETWPDLIITLVLKDWKLR
ncbi:hypothetical protein ACXGQW_08820 [Wenyingzhuangia sp. IMCC45533]